MRGNSIIINRLGMALIVSVFVLTAMTVRAAGPDSESDLSTERLNQVEVQNLLEKGTTEDQQRLFNQLTQQQKTWAFERLSIDDQVKAFNWLPTDEKQILFNQLETQAKSRLFSRLNYEDQEVIFNSLEDRVKSQLLSSMSEDQRQRWLARSPGLNLYLTKDALPPEEADQPATKPPPLEKEPLSRMEKIMSGAFPQTIDRELVQFGYDFFKTSPVLAPPPDVSVGDDYILGPEDRFTIYLWGKVEKEYTVTVSREGTVVLPNIGSLAVAQLTFKEAKELLQQKFREYYPEFSMSMTIDRLRSIQVYVVGEVQKPGAYNISVLSTVIDALSAAGGPRKSGSLRHIKVTSHEDTSHTLDLYDFLIHGRKADDIRLSSGDTIFVPVIGMLSGIAGNVRRPGIYEIRPSTDLGQLMGLAGGVMPTAHLQNVVVERVAANQRRIIKSFNLSGVHAQDALKGTMLADGDVVKVFPVHRQLRQVVFLEGHIKYPREYEYRPGMRVADLIPSYEVLLPEPFLDRAEIIRLMPPDWYQQIIEFDLGALLKGDESHNPTLQDMDRVVVYAVAEKMELPQVTISGAVRKPGTYRLYRGMRVSDLIFSADNLLPSAFLGNASLSRVVVGKGQTDVVTIDFSPELALAGDPIANTELKPSDSIYIREIPNYNDALERKVVLEGEFAFPGEYTFSVGERLSSVIMRAGGLTDIAYPFGAVFLREDVKDVQKQRIREYVNSLEEDILSMTSQAAETSLEKDEAEIYFKSLASKKQLLEKIRTSQPTGRMVVNLDKVIYESGSEQDFKLQPGDRLIVKKQPDYVNVLGEVYNPTALLAVAENPVGYYLNQVGGITDSAEKKQIYLVRANGTVISKSQEAYWGTANWDTDNERWSWGGFESIKVNPGDTIVVPKKVDQYAWLRITKGITEIAFQMAVIAGVLIAVF